MFLICLAYALTAFVSLQYLYYRQHRFYYFCLLYSQAAPSAANSVALFDRFVARFERLGLAGPTNRFSPPLRRRISCCQALFRCLQLGAKADFAQCTRHGPIGQLRNWFSNLRGRLKLSPRSRLRLSCERETLLDGAKLGRSACGAPTSRAIVIPGIAGSRERLRRS